MALQDITDGVNQGWTPTIPMGINQPAGGSMASGAGMAPGLTQSVADAPNGTRGAARPAPATPWSAPQSPMSANTYNSQWVDQQRQQPHPLFDMFGIQRPQPENGGHTPGKNYAMTSSGVGLNPGGVGSGNVGLDSGSPTAWNQNTKVAMDKRRAGQRLSDADWRLLVDHDHYEELNASVNQPPNLSMGPKDAAIERAQKAKQDQMDANAGAIDGMYEANPEIFNQWGFHPNTASTAEKASMLPTMIKAIQGHIGDQQRQAAVKAENTEKETLQGNQIAAAEKNLNTNIAAREAEQGVRLTAQQAAAEAKSDTTINQNMIKNKSTAQHEVNAEIDKVLIAMKSGSTPELHNRLLQLQRMANGFTAAPAVAPRSAPAIQPSATPAVYPAQPTSQQPSILAPAQPAQADANSYVNSIVKKK